MFDDLTPSEREQMKIVVKDAAARNALVPWISRWDIGLNGPIVEKSWAHSGYADADTAIDFVIQRDATGFIGCAGGQVKHVTGVWPNMSFPIASLNNTLLMRGRSQSDVAEAFARLVDGEPLHRILTDYPRR